MRGITVAVLLAATANANHSIKVARGTPFTLPLAEAAVAPRRLSCVSTEITMSDSWGDGWGFTSLHVGNLTFTLTVGNFDSFPVCLDEGVYRPYACGGDYLSEVSWTVGPVRGRGDESCRGSTALEVSLCGPGTAGFDGACSACEPGTYTLAGSKACTPCPAGTYSSNSGASSCAKCAAGTSSAVTGRTTACTDLCAAGMYSSSAGASTCAACPAGSYASGEGATSCARCGAGKAAPAGSAACGGCPDGSSMSNGRCYTGQHLSTATLRAAVAAWCADPATAAITYGDIATWDTSGVVDMSGLFGQYWDGGMWVTARYCSSFATFNSAGVSSWDVSQVTTFYCFLSYSAAFNQALNGWDTSKVSDMGGMLSRTSSFNQALEAWDISQVTKMWSCFFLSAFNQALETWDVSQVADFAFMFYFNKAFNQALNKWDMSSATDIQFMFSNSAFDQSIGDWDISTVTDIKYMLASTAFNHDISLWDVSRITSMPAMFSGTYFFNQPLGTWDVSKVTDMYGTFYIAAGFNQDLSSWDIRKVVITSDMFHNSVAFNQVLCWNLTSKFTSSMFAFSSGSVDLGANKCNCGAGTYYNGTRCAPCFAGQYSLRGRATSCFPCPAGTDSPAASASCISPTPQPTRPRPSPDPTPEPTSNPTPEPTLTPTLLPTPLPTATCVSGQYLIGSTCLNCPVGRTTVFDMLPWPGECEECPAGSFNNQAGKSPCVACVQGKYSVADRTLCEDCSAGEFVSGMLSCVKCPAGQFAPRPLQDACIPCSIGMFAAEVGASTCANCAAELGPGYTSSEAANSCTMCIAGFVNVHGLGEIPACVQCEKGDFKHVKCESIGTTLASIDLKRGYWRTGDTSSDIRTCRFSDACSGGSDPSSSCRRGHIGPYCAVCDKNYYPDVSSRCLECATSGGGVTEALVGLAGVVAVVMIISGVGYELNKCMSRSTKKRVINVAKIIFVFFQVVCSVPANFAVIFPEPLGGFLNGLGVLGLDIPLASSLRCMWPATNFYTELFVATLAPFGAVLATIVVKMLRSYRHFNDGGRVKLMRDSCTGPALLVIYIFLPVTSRTIFGSFACEGFDDGRTMLAIDLSISCDEPFYRIALMYAIAMVIVWPVGIPALFSVILFTNRSAIRGQSLVQARRAAGRLPPLEEDIVEARDVDTSLDSIRLLFDTYRPSTWYWELWVTSRRLVLTGAIVMLQRGSVIQSTAGVFTGIISALMQSSFRPYVEHAENLIAFFVEVHLICALYLSLMLTMDAGRLEGSSGKGIGVLLVTFTALIIVGGGIQIILAFCFHSERNGVETELNNLVSPSAYNGKSSLKSFRDWERYKASKSLPIVNEASAGGVEMIQQLSVASPSGSSSASSDLLAFAGSNPLFNDTHAATDETSVVLPSYIHPPLGTGEGISSSAANSQEVRRQSRSPIATSLVESTLNSTTATAADNYVGV